VQPDDLVNAVLALEDEQDVTRVGEAAGERMKQLRAERNLELRRSLRIGQRVRVNSRISPKYLQGLTGTIAAPPGEKRVSVKWDHPSLARQYSADDGRAQVGLGALEVIPDDEGAAKSQPVS
jgi:hypothetical protein